MKYYFSANIALELPSAATLGAAVMGRGSTQALLFLTMSGIGNRSRTPGTLPGFPD